LRCLGRLGVTHGLTDAREASEGANGDECTGQHDAQQDDRGDDANDERRAIRLRRLWRSSVGWLAGILARRRAIAEARLCRVRRLARIRWWLFAVLWIQRLRWIRRLRIVRLLGIIWLLGIAGLCRVIWVLIALPLWISRILWRTHRKSSLVDVRRPASADASSGARSAEFSAHAA
jgi:hypothetical protein